MTDEIVEYEEAAVIERDITTITAEINVLKAEVVKDFIEIGKRLIEAKEQLGHGEWLPWLSSSVQFSEDSAQRFMRLAREYGDGASNTAPVRYLGVSKALQLLALPDFQREEFIAEKHEVNGVEKSVYDMTKKELDDALKEKLELQSQVDEYSNRADELAEQIEMLKAQLKAAEGPKEVSAVEVVPDKEAEDKLKAQIKELKDKAKETSTKLEELKKKAAEAEASKQKAIQEKDTAVREAAEKSKERYEQQIESLKKQLIEAGDSDVAVFKVHFDAIQKEAAEMKKCIERLKASNKTEEADKLANAYKAVINTLSSIL